MTIKLTENQIQRVLRGITKEQLIDFLSEDVERSVEWLRDFIWNYVDSEKTQNRLKQAFPPIQMELFDK